MLSLIVATALVLCVPVTIVGVFLVERAEKMRAAHARRSAKQ